MIKTLQKEFSDNNQKAECLTVMSGNAYNIVDISLPNNFFEQIITNEVELSEGFKYDKLEKLVQLYLNAIQYYSSTQPEKVKAYQNRMEYLLTQKDTLKNLCKLRNDGSSASKSSNQIRGRAKTKFMIQSKVIKKDEIENRVNQVMQESINIKEQKKNVKILIDNEYESQSKKWKKKLAQKRSLMSSMRPLLRTSGRKFFNTPGPIARKSLNIESNKLEISKFEKSGKIPKYGEIDDDSEDDNKSDNADADFIKMFKEKHNKEENKKDSDDEGSIIDDNYNDEILDKIEEVEEENIKQSEQNVIKNFNENDKEENINKINQNNIESKKSLKGILKNKIKSIVIKENEKKEEENNKESNKELENNKEENNNEVKKDEENNKEQNNNEQKNEEENNKESKKEIEKEEDDSLAAKNKEIKNNEENELDKVPPFQRKKSIVDENVIREIEPEEEIKNIIEEKMKILDNINNGEESGEESNLQSSTSLPNITKKVNIEEIPPIFQETFMAVESKMKEYIQTLNNHFYKETFEDFSLKLKELYDSKYEKYIMVNNEYHSSITEKEYLLENEENLNEEKKLEIQNIIDSLKEEQKDQIDKIVDEYNNNIILLINEFKQNSFKKNTSIQLLEEQLKLDIYSMINEAFY